MNDWTEVPEQVEEQKDGSGPQMAMLGSEREDIDKLIMSSNEVLALYGRVHASGAKEGLHAFIKDELERRTNLGALVDAVVDLSLAGVIAICKSATNMDATVVDAVSKAYAYRAMCVEDVFNMVEDKSGPKKGA